MIHCKSFYSYDVVIFLTCIYAVEIHTLIISIFLDYKCGLVLWVDLTKRYVTEEPRSEDGGPSSDLSSIEDDSPTLVDKLRRELAALRGAGKHGKKTSRRVDDGNLFYNI